jgi:uncharacterized RDD family membrane protein YckC
MVARAPAQAQYGDAVSSQPPPPPPPPPPPAGWGQAQQSYSPPGVPGGYAGVPATGGQVALPLASKGKRFGGLLLELVLGIITLGIGWLIWSIVIWEKGLTPAKSILGMRVIKDSTMRPATRGDMALRELVGKVVLSVIPFYQIVSGVFVLATDDATALWDKVAHTHVVDDPNNYFQL